MLLQLSDSLEEKIVRTLALGPWQSAPVLRDTIGRQFGEYTLRGVYKELAKLEAEGIVVKVKGKYSLRLAWVFHLISFVDSLYDVYLEPSLLQSFFSGTAEKLSWHFTNLSKMDMAWTQLMLGLHQMYRDKTMCIWCPHQWFDLAHGDKQRQFMAANELAKNKRLHIIGGRTYLDRLSISSLPKSSRFSFAEGPFESLRSTYYTLIGDAIITVKLDKLTTHRMEELFERVKSAKDITQGELQRFFQQPVKVRLTLETNERKAAQIKRKFASFFGVPVGEIG